MTSFKSTTLLCGTDNIPWNIPHIQIECEKYSMEYCQSQRPLLRLLSTGKITIGGWRGYLEGAKRVQPAIYYARMLQEIIISAQDSWQQVKCIICRDFLNSVEFKWDHSSTIDKVFAADVISKRGLPHCAYICLSAVSGRNHTDGNKLTPLCHEWWLSCSKPITTHRCELVPPSVVPPLDILSSHTHNIIQFHNNVLWDWLYCAEYKQFHTTLLCSWIMLWSSSDIRLINKQVY